MFRNNLTILWLNIERKADRKWIYFISFARGAFCTKCRGQYWRNIWGGKLFHSSTKVLQYWWYCRVERLYEGHKLCPSRTDRPTYIWSHHKNALIPNVFALFEPIHGHSILQYIKEVITKSIAGYVSIVHSKSLSKL